jgi:hypothetical protein
MKCHQVRVLCWGAAVAAMLAGAAAGQNPRPARAPQFFESPTCAEEISGSSGDSRAARLNYVSYLRNADECGAPLHDRWRSKQEEPSKTPPTLSARDSVQPVANEFLGMGVAGFAIAAIRQQVILILRENNSCSAWYAQAEPNPSEKFSSLHFRIDSEGEDTSFSDYNSFGQYYREPYVARAQQEVGAGSTITLNAHGAFFQWQAPAKLRWGAGPVLQQSPRPLRVGIYSGNSLNGQVTTLLHEFGHIVGLLPIDSGEANSAVVSTRNTDIVLHHCRKQIEASANRTIMLPASLAELERLAQRAEH